MGYKISADLDPLEAAPAVGDLLVIVDISDTTQGAAGSTKKITASYLFTDLVLTTPQINDTTADHQYVLAVSELTADRTVTLPLLTGNDEFVFKDHTQTLTNKTLTSPVLNSGVSGTAVADEDDMSSDSATLLVTQQSTKAYVDDTVAAHVVEQYTKVGSFDRDVSTASGDQVITGVGFQPKALIVMGVGASGTTDKIVFGMADSSLAEMAIFEQTGPTYQRNTTKLISLYHYGGAGNYLTAVLKTFDVGGFTLTWTKTGAPTGTAQFIYLAIANS